MDALNMKSIAVYLGYDARQPIAFQVAAHSIWKQATTPVSITRLDIRQLPIKRTGLTAFTFSRFLVPYLSGYHGVSIFMDSDVLVRADVTELLAYPLMEPKVPVFVAQGPRKFEWASVMVFNNQLCQALTPAYIDNPKMNPLMFAWAASVGQLHLHWNHLVGYDRPNPNAKLVHLTQGLPIWEETCNCEFADEWKKTAEESMGSVSFEELMGRSVHAPHVHARLRNEKSELDAHSAR